MNARSSSLRVLVAQLGARRHYIVPAALHAENMLYACCTDLYAGHGFLRAALIAASRVARSDGLGRWAARVSDRLPDECVTAFNRFGLLYRRRTRSARSATELTGAWLWGGRRFCELVVERGFGSATAVYAFTSAALELLAAASRAGLVCVLDHATAPKLFEERLVREEREYHAALFPEIPPDERAAEYAERQRQEWDLADVIVCGSSFVRKAIESERGPVGKTVVVPLGLAPDCAAAPRAARRPGPLRVLFAGDDGLRKGVADLALAAELLGPGRLEIRAAGAWSLTQEGRRKLQGVMTLLGHVPRSEMQAHYRWADVFAMPSVSDTFGLVILEAMAAGLPVIATPNTGAADVVRHGVDGYIVPVRSAGTMAEALERLASDEALLRELAQHAAERAGEFTIDRYARRLVEGIQSPRMDRQPSVVP